MRYWHTLRWQADNDKGFKFEPRKALLDLKYGRFGLFRGANPRKASRRRAHYDTYSLQNLSANTAYAYAGTRWLVMCYGYVLCFFL